MLSLLSIHIAAAAAAAQHWQGQSGVELFFGEHSAAAAAAAPAAF